MRYHLYCWRLTGFWNLFHFSFGEYINKPNVSFKFLISPIFGIGVSRLSLKDSQILPCLIPGINFTRRGLIGRSGRGGERRQELHGGRRGTKYGGGRCGSGVCKLRLHALSSTRAAAYPSLIHSLPKTRCCKVLSFHFTHEEARLLKGTVPVKEQKILRVNGGHFLAHVCNTQLLDLVVWRRSARSWGLQCPSMGHVGLGLSGTSLELLGNWLPARRQTVLLWGPGFEALGNVW